MELIMKYKELLESSFEMVDHELKHSLGWYNDKLLVLFKK